MTKHTRRNRSQALLASGVILAAALAGCSAAAGGTTSASGTSSGTSSRTPDNEIMTIVNCYRAHGDPSFPDPVYDPSDGRWHFGISPGSAPAGTQRACQHLFPSSNASPPVPQAQFQKLVRLAECIRQHGVPAWPDPDPEGSYPLPPSLQTKTPASVNALKACQRYVPSGGINAHAAAS
jgi:hypothetical protein